MLTKREFLLSCAVIGVCIVGIFELGKSIPVVAAPPVTGAFSICDPSNNGNCANVNANGFLKSSTSTDSNGNSTVSVVSQYPVNPTSGVAAVPQAATSGNVANATAAATLPAAVGKTTYATGFSCESGGATAAADVDITLTGALGGTMHFAFDGGALATGNAIPRIFNPALPASAVNTALVISMPALGSGNTNATCNIEGYQL